MAYVPKDWVTGEVITESALDHIEQGIADAGGVLVVHYHDDPNNAGQILCEYTLDEILAKIDSGMAVMAHYKDSTGNVFVIPCANVYNNKDYPQYAIVEYEFLQGINITSTDYKFYAIHVYLKHEVNGITFGNNEIAIPA